MATSSGQTYVVVGDMRVHVIKGSIADQQVECIVNSSNCSLNLSRGQASKALLEAAGDEIQTECNENYPSGLQNGEIAVTSGGQLSCKAIYHGALSKYTSTEDEEFLKNLIDVSLDQAETDGYRTIAFPALGTGLLGYPTERVVKIFFSCMERASTQSLEDVLLVIFPNDRDTFKKFLTFAKTYSASETANSEKGKYGSTKIGNVNVRVVVGEMSRVKADVIVCSGPTDLQLNNNGLSQSLSDVAGPEMQEELDQNYPNGIEYGDFAISNGYNLQCRFVYHGALPKWSTTDPDPSSTMEELIDNCLETADQHNAKTIAFPSLGVGSLSFPVEESAQLMGECIRYFCTNPSTVNIETIIIVVYNSSSNFTDVQKEFVKELSGGPLPAYGSHGYQGLSVTSRKSYCARIGNISVSLHVGNITEHQVDAIVNSVASDLSMSSGTAAAIQAAAGPGLLRELAQNYPMGIQGGEIAVAKGYSLKCKEVFNGTLLPWYSKRFSNVKLPEEVLEEFVTACLELAKKRNLGSIAFPALGTGYHKIPADVAAESIVAAIDKYSYQQKQQNIIWGHFTKYDLEKSHATTRDHGRTSVFT